MVSPAVSLTVRFSAPISAHRCPRRQSTHGPAQLVTDPSTLMNCPMVSLSSSLIFHILLHPSSVHSAIPGLIKKFIQGSAENALLCSTPFPTDKIKVKQRSAIRLKRERGKCDVCVRMRAFVHCRRCGNSRLQT